MEVAIGMTWKSNQEIEKQKLKVLKRKIAHKWNPNERN